jgi:hypothetical protein
MMADKQVERRFLQEVRQLGWDPPPLLGLRAFISLTFSLQLDLRKG